MWAKRYTLGKRRLIYLRVKMAGEDMAETPSIKGESSPSNHSSDDSFTQFDGSTFLQTWVAELITGVFVMLAVCVTSVQVSKILKVYLKENSGLNKKILHRNIVISFHQLNKAKFLWSICYHPRMIRSNELLVQFANDVLSEVNWFLH